MNTNQNILDNCSFPDNFSVMYSDYNKIDIAEIKSYRFLMPTFSIIIIVLNAIVVLSTAEILKKGTEPRATYLFMGNIAFLDFSIGILCLFGLFYPYTKRSLNACLVYTSWVASSCFISIYSVGLIAIDRFIYILYGLKYKTLMKPSNTYKMLFAVWIVGLLVGHLPLLGWYELHNTSIVCWFNRIAKPHFVITFTIILAIPIITVCILYFIILYHAIKRNLQLRRLRNSNGIITNDGIRMFSGRSDQNSNSHKTTPSEWKAIKVIFLTTGSFAFAWMPYLIRSSIIAYTTTETNSEQCKDRRIVKEALLIVLAYLNCLLNPLIYAWWHQGFRNEINKRFNKIVTRCNFSKIYQQPKVVI